MRPPVFPGCIINQRNTTFMRKKELRHVVLSRGNIKKPLLIMRLTTFLILCFCLGGYASGFSQHKMSLQAGEITYQQLFEEIRKQTGCIVMYNNSTLDKGAKVKVGFSDADLEEVLKETLKTNGYAYETSGEFILIVKGERPQAERVEIRGIVVDTKGEPLPGTSVFIKNTSIGVSTDISGRFTLLAEPGEQPVLVFSFIGMRSKEVVYTGQKEIRVTLEDEVSEVEEVVVTGYQRIERRKMTSSITTIDMDRLKTVNQPNIDKLLQGQVPGMVIMSTSGAPGAVPQIRIRGTSTISGNVQPLWVVDGIILDDPINVDVGDILTNRNLIASGIGGVNVDDIESINVLKDAAATAIYGTKAANGVIVITSKKGNSGKTRISYTGSLTLGMQPRLKDAHMMNSKERIDVNMEMIRRGAFKATSSNAGEYGTVSDFERYYIDVQDRKMTWSEFEQKVNQLETVNTDWFDELFRNAITQRHSLSISGGTAKTNFYISGSYMDEQATAKKVSQQTYTSSVKVTTRLHDNLKVGSSVDLNMRRNRSFFATDSRENPYEWAIYTTRAHNAYNEDGSFNHLYINNVKYNFMENREHCWRESKSFGFRGNVDLEWRIIPDLTFTTLFSYSNQNTTEEDIATENSYFVRQRQANVYQVINYTTVYIWEEGGYRKIKNTNNNSLTFRNQLSYMPAAWGDHRMDLMIGQEIRTSKYEDETTQIYGYVHDRGRQQVMQYELMEYLGVPYWNMNLNKTAALSWYGVAGYSYKNRYTISFNARIDGSNRFGIKTNDLFQPLWAIGLNYQMKEENFLKDVNWVSYLTLKGSYGSQGNVASQAYSDLVATIGTIDAVKNENYLTINAPKNPNLKWEKTNSTNVALEFGLFNRKITGVVEYYHKKAVDLLGSKQVSLVSGFTSVQVNWASMLNRGWEFSLNTIPVDFRDFRWSSNINAGYNYNEVLDVYSVPTYATLTNPQRTNYASAAVVGKPINGLWSYRYAGLNEEGRAQFYNEKDEKVLKNMKNIDGLAYSGSTMPSWQGGWTNTFNYKKWTLSALLIGNFGNVIRLRNLTKDYVITFPEASQNMAKEFASRWQKPGDEAYTDIPVLEADPYESSLFSPYPSNAQMYNNSDLRTVKGDFVRLQNLSLSYDLYNDKMRNMGIQNIRFMLQGNNLHAWHTSKLKGQDPEATGAIMRHDAVNNANVSFGNTYLPIPRTYSFSVNIQF